MTAAAVRPTICIHPGCKQDGRYETPKGWVCGGHFPDLAAFTGVRTFCATKARDRDELGETVTDWLRANPAVEVVDKIVVQSSDEQYHCLSIVIFFR